MAQNSRQNKNVSKGGNAYGKGKQTGKNTNNNPKSKRSTGGNVKREQPRKDSGSKRVNYDNAREDKVAKQIMSDAKSGKFNDINDFLKNPMLLQAAASYPVFPILGQPLNEKGLTVPGIMAFYWAPNFGSPQRGLAKKNVGALKLTLSGAPLAINQAADSTYSYLVHANSRNYNYNAPDLFLLIVAGSQVFAIIEAMKRAYGMAKNYVETNRYYPDAVLEAMGFDPVNLRQNLGQAWFDINNLIVQTRQIWVPNEFPIVGRWMDLNSNLYTDAEGLYSQTYIYVQSRYYRYNETQLNTGGLLETATYTSGSGATAKQVKFSPSATNQYSWATWVAVAQDMIDRLINSEDRGIIYGDLLNAYTAERIIAIPEMSSDYTVMPEYSPEISMQIENTTLIPTWMSIPSGVAQYENKLYTTWEDRTGISTQITNRFASKGVLNFHTTSDPTPEMILLATRFHILGARAASVLDAPSTPGPVDPVTNNLWLPNVSGSEIIYNIAICKRDRSNTASTNWFFYTTLNLAGGDSDVPNTSQLMDFRAFDWSPFFYMAGSSAQTYDPKPSDDQVLNGTVMESIPTNAYGDFDRYTISEADLLTKINDVAEYSLYGVPQL